MTDPKRSQIGKIGANARWAMEENRTAATQPARDALYRKFEDQVDPERKLSGPERARRVENARRAYYQRLAMKAVEARRAKRQGAAKKKPTPMTPAEYGRMLADAAPPLAEWQLEAAARILASVLDEQEGVSAPRGAERARRDASRDVTRSGSAATGPGMKKAPGAATPEAQVPKGKILNNTEGTTAAPKGATTAPAGCPIDTPWCVAHLHGEGQCVSTSYDIDPTLSLWVVQSPGEAAPSLVIDAGHKPLPWHKVPVFKASLMALLEEVER